MIRMSFDDGAGDNGGKLGGGGKVRVQPADIVLDAKNDVVKEKAVPLAPLPRVELHGASGKKSSMLAKLHKWIRDASVTKVALHVVREDGDVGCGGRRGRAACGAMTSTDMSSRDTGFVSRMDNGGARSGSKSRSIDNGDGMRYSSTNRRREARDGNQRRMGLGMYKGTSVKLMRDIGGRRDPNEVSDSGMEVTRMRAGCGIRYEIDQGRLRIVSRSRVDVGARGRNLGHVSVHLLPVPEFRVRCRVPLTRYVGLDCRLNSHIMNLDEMMFGIKLVDTGAKGLSWSKGGVVDIDTKVRIGYVDMC